MFATDCLVVDNHIAKIFQSAYQVERLLPNVHLSQQTAILNDLEAELLKQY